MDLLLPAVNLLLRKNNISFALSSVSLKRVKMNLSLSLGILVRAEKEHKKKPKRTLKELIQGSIIYNSVDKLRSPLQWITMPRDLFCKFCPELGNTTSKKESKLLGLVHVTLGTEAILSIWISRGFDLTHVGSYASPLLHRGIGTVETIHQVPEQDLKLMLSLHIHGYIHSFMELNPSS